MSTQTYPYGTELTLAIRLGGAYHNYPNKKRVYLKQAARGPLMLVDLTDQAPLSEYWFELLPGCQWQACTNDWGNAAMLPLMTEQMVAIVKKLEIDIEAAEKKTSKK